MINWRLIIGLCRVAAARLRGIEMAGGCALGAGVSLSRGIRAGQPGRVRVGPRTELARGAVLQAWGGAIDVGARVWIGEYAVIYGQGGVEIGEGTLVAMHSRIISSNHTVPGREQRIRDQPDILLPTRIGRDVWLGAGVTVLGGVTVGDGCVVAAGAVVTKDLPPYTIARGVPARVVGSRD